MFQCNRDSLSKKPLIASISGYAVDVGFELTLMCDYRIMEETASMGFLNRRLGIPIMCGGTVRLPAMIGYSRAMDMILTGRVITSDEAFNWGLVNLVVPCGAGNRYKLLKFFKTFIFYLFNGRNTVTIYII